MPRSRVLSLITCDLFHSRQPYVPPLDEKLIGHPYVSATKEPSPLPVTSLNPFPSPRTSLQVSSSISTSQPHPPSLQIDATSITPRRSSDTLTYLSSKALGFTNPTQANERTSSTATVITTSTNTTTPKTTSPASQPNPTPNSTRATNLAHLLVLTLQSLPRHASRDGTLEWEVAYLLGADGLALVERGVSASSSSSSSTSHPPNGSPQRLVFICAWAEQLAKCVLTGVQRALERSGNGGSGGLMKDTGAMARREVRWLMQGWGENMMIMKQGDPDADGLMALGVCAALMAWVVEALGFAEDGVKEGSFAADWLDRLGMTKKESIYSFLQVMGVRWNIVLRAIDTE